jgi:hypothetical protein
MERRIDRRRAIRFAAAVAVPFLAVGAISESGKQRDARRTPAPHPVRIPFTNTFITEANGIDHDQIEHDAQSYPLSTEFAQVPHPADVEATETALITEASSSLQDGEILISIDKDANQITVFADTGRSVGSSITTLDSRERSPILHTRNNLGEPEVNILLEVK